MTLGHICKAVEKEGKAAAKAAASKGKAAPKAAKAAASKGKAAPAAASSKAHKTPVKAKKAPEENSAEPNLNMSWKCVHSRAWHGAYNKALKNGKSDVCAKDIAKLAGQKAHEDWDNGQAGQVY
jgi:hypothetical protein